jgi:uncharacterized membrane protein YphA (DoxX/SURF4 family)
VVLAFVFIYAGTIKFLHPEAFLADIEGYRLLDYNAAWFLAFYLPPLEIICGVGVLLPLRYRMASAILLSVLVGVFVVAILSAWFRGLDISCGCFGGTESHTHYPSLLLRDIAMLAGLVFVACRRPGIKLVSRPHGQEA